MTTNFSNLMAACLALAAASTFTAAQVPPKDAKEAPWHDEPGVERTQDPKALEILTAGIDALGGKDAILGRSSIYIKWKVLNHEYPDVREGTITLWYRRAQDGQPEKMRKEIEYPGIRHVEVYDGKRAWYDSGDGPRMRGPLITASIRDGLEELDLPVNYLDAELTYFNISQEIPGKLAHVVKIRKNGYTKELMFDVSTNLLQVSGEYENPWGATDKMKKFERYRPVDGVLIPFRVENWRSNRMISETEILEVKFNEPIDDSLFSYPDSQAASAP